MGDSKRDIDVQNSLLDSVGEGEGGMIWEDGDETCIMSYNKTLTWANLNGYLSPETIPNWYV